MSKAFVIFQCPPSDCPWWQVGDTVTVSPVDHPQPRHAVYVGTRRHGMNSRSSPPTPMNNGHSLTPFPIPSGINPNPTYRFPGGVSFNPQPKLCFKSYDPRRFHSATSRRGRREKDLRHEAGAANPEFVGLEANRNNANKGGSREQGTGDWSGEFPDSLSARDLCPSQTVSHTSLLVVMN